MEILTPDNVKAQNKRIFNLQEHNSFLKLKLNLVEDKEIKLSVQCILSQQKWKIKLEMEDLLKLSSFFSFTQSINESYSFLTNIFEEKKFTFTFTEKTILLLMEGQNIELTYSFRIILNKQQTEQEKQIFQLEQNISAQSNKLLQNEKNSQQMKSELTQLFDQLNALQNSDKQSGKDQLRYPFISNLRLLELILIFFLFAILIPNQIPRDYSHQSKTEQLQLKSSNESQILFKSEIPLIKSWIERDYKSLSRDIKFTPLYRASHGNFQIKDFYEKCSNQGSTLVLIKTKQYEQRLGGFTKAEWDENSNCIKTDNVSSTFLFSLDDKRKYSARSQRLPCEIGCSEDQISFSSDLILRETQKGLFNLNYFCEGDCETIIEPQFEIAELEVYKVEF